MTTYYYFAGRYSRHAELASYRSELEASGLDVCVTSRWLDCHNGELEASYTPEALNADPEGCWQHGAADIADLEEADVCVSFTGDGGGGKGGRHIEHGYHLASIEASRAGSAFRIVVVGPRENIFHCHPRTEVFPDWASFLAAEVGRVR